MTAERGRAFSESESDSELIQKEAKCLKKPW